MLSSLVPPGSRNKSRTKSVPTPIPTSRPSFRLSNSSQSSSLDFSSQPMFAFANTPTTATAESPRPTSKTANASRKRTATASTLTLTRLSSLAHSLNRTRRALPSQRTRRPPRIPSTRPFPTSSTERLISTCLLRPIVLQMSRCRMQRPVRTSLRRVI